MSVGVFQDLVQVFNRAPIAISVKFDGQEHTMQPGVNLIPRVTLTYAKNQNPLKGSADLDNPTASGVEFLIGIVGGKDNCDPLTEDEWAAHVAAPSRFNTEDIMDLASRRLPPGSKMVLKNARKQNRFSVALNPNTEFGGGD